MIIVEPCFRMMYPESREQALESLHRVELAGRLCYKSEDRITPNSYKRFIEMLIQRGHWSVIEHATMTAHLTTNRGVTHELVRHRIASFSQESTRYCNYQHGKFGGAITVVRPPELPEDQTETWERAMAASEAAYLDFIQAGVSPQIARGVLPNDLKAEIIVTANVREWHHIFDLRCSEKAHPHMRSLMKLGLSQCVDWFAPVFDDLVHLLP